MNEFNKTDREEVEMLKKWWKDSGKSIAIAIVIGLVVSFGWQGWRKYQRQQKQEASILYQSLSVSDYQKKPKLAEKFAQQLMKDYRRSPYATFAALWSAKEALQKNNLVAALASCQWVLKNSKVSSLQQIARIRAARVLLAQKKPKKAMSILAKVDDETFEPLIENVKGDIYTFMGDSKAAHKAYQAAKIGMSSSINTSDPLLGMKLAQPFQ